MPLRTALAQSYNAASARLGTELGVERVLATVKRLGIERALQPYAATLLGAVELSPLEVAQMYQTIASGGFRAPLRAIREVTTQDGRPLKRYPIAVEQAFPPEPMYLLAAAMQGIVREGTAQSLKNWLPPESAVAGKTGTTDEQRDAWFAGFTGDRLAYRVDRLRRQPRGAPLRRRRRAAGVGRDDGHARPGAARPRQAGRHRDRADRSGERIARRRGLRGRNRAAVRARIGAGRARALRVRAGRRGRRGKQQTKSWWERLFGN